MESDEMPENQPQQHNRLRLREAIWFRRAKRWTTITVSLLGTLAAFINAINAIKG
jgi:hypothetical protein